jgi:hypothetical protein
VGVRVWEWEWEWGWGWGWGWGWVCVMCVCVTEPRGCTRGLTRLVDLRYTDCIVTADRVFSLVRHVVPSLLLSASMWRIALPRASSSHSLLAYQSILLVVLPARASTAAVRGAAPRADDDEQEDAVGLCSRRRVDGLDCAVGTPLTAHWLSIFIVFARYLPPLLCPRVWLRDISPTHAAAAAVVTVVPVVPVVAAIRAGARLHSRPSLTRPLDWQRRATTSLLVSLRSSLCRLSTRCVVTCTALARRPCQTHS